MTAQRQETSRSAVLVTFGLLLIAASLLWWRPGQKRPGADGLIDDVAAQVAARTTPTTAIRAIGSPFTGPGAQKASTAAQLPLSLSLEAIGEITLADGHVQRTYRVRVVNNDEWRTGVEAELVSAGTGIVIIKGRVELGDLAPNAPAVVADTITLRHDPEQQIDASGLQWRFGEVAGGSASGTLLSGAANDLAFGVLHAFDAEAAMPQLSVVLKDQATVGHVNAALREVNAVIVQMRPGSPTIALRLRQPDRNDSLASAADRLQASGAFEWSRPMTGSLADPVETDGENIPPPDPEPEFDDHRPQ